MLQSVLAPLSDEDLVAILEKRVARCTASEWLAFMQSEEADDVFEKDDEKLRQAELKRHEGKEERSTVFRTQY